VSCAPLSPTGSGRLFDTRPGWRILPGRLERNIDLRHARAGAVRAAQLKILAISWYSVLNLLNIIPQMPAIVTAISDPSSAYSIAVAAASSQTNPSNWEATKPDAPAVDQH
jgi:hypothetical protein